MLACLLCRFLVLASLFFFLLSIWNICEVEIRNEQKKAQKQKRNLTLPVGFGVIFKFFDSVNENS